MKKNLSPFYAIMLALSMASVVFAQVTYDKSVFTSYQVANLGTSPANITVKYYDASGTTTSGSDQVFASVPAGASVVVQQSTESTLGTGIWSAVVSADQPIAAVVNQQLGVSGSGSSYPPFSSYSGASAGATNVLLPEIMYNWFNNYTEIYIQNAGTAAASNITIEYYPTKIGTCTTGATGQVDTVASAGNTLAQYASRSVSQFAKTNLAASGCTSAAYFNGRFLGSAVVKSDQPVVVVVNHISPGKLFTYNGFTTADAGTRLLLPAYLKGFYGFYASLTVANPSLSSSVTFTPTYKSDASFSNPKSTTVVGTPRVIGPGQSVNIYDGAPSSNSDLDGQFGATGQRFFGTVQIDASAPVVAIVNQESVPTSGGKAGSYNGLVTSAGTQKISVPLIQSSFYGLYTSLSIMTVDGTDATLRITYKSDSQFSALKNATQTYTMTTTGGFLNRYEGPTASATQSDLLDDSFWAAPGTRNRFIGAATIEVISGPNIVAFVNSETGGDTTGYDTMYTFNTFNQ